MNEQPLADPVESVVADAPTPVGVVVKRPAASLQLLGDDEIIQLSIRPSPWWIALHSYKLVLAMALVAAAIAIATPSWYSSAASVALTAVVLVAFSGVLAATLQWASRIYVLTNRRVLSFRGVFNVDVAECALPRIGAAQIQTAAYQRLLRLGSIHLKPTSQDKPVMVWEHVARPSEVHEILVRAVQKSKTGQ